MRTDEPERSLQWIRRCADSSCVEVARDGDDVVVRDGKDAGGPRLRFTGEAWKSFQAGVAAGEFDRV
ncbi:DUF397 domain-containing protein [Actinoplanes sp. NPDC049118]|uniref:DUF397 domain-containing protein n=1 Tax=Actinoplanes sp. NPDC049118 TaxID=3155769 RepID=UPI0033C00355